MTKVTISGNANGTGNVNFAAPNTNSAITVTLPTSNVDMDNLGPSTTYGDVGTYIMGCIIQGRVAEGSTAAGSSIRNLTLHAYSTTSMSYGTLLSPQGYFYSSDLMSGTWRQMFDAGIGNSSNNGRAGLWVRIS